MLAGTGSVDADLRMQVVWHPNGHHVEIVALEQEGDQVTATIEGPAGRSTITAAYVAGCDGARSAVREMNGIGFPGEPYEHVFFVADTEALGPMVQDELNVYLYRNGRYHKKYMQM